MSSNKFSKQDWESLGRVFEPPSNASWFVSHASNVFAEPIDNNICRFYFSGRDENKVSSLGYVDINIQNKAEIINISKAPVLIPGQEGNFDDRGIALGNIINIDGKKILYYMGWHHDNIQPWTNKIGLAVWNDKIHRFEAKETPVLGLDDIDPYTLSYPYVAFDRGLYKMWYGSHLTWGEKEDLSDMKHAIKYAESTDGVNWTKSGKTCLSPKDTELGLSRPSVFIDDTGYHMWYSLRDGVYRVGYAFSEDGVKWERQDNNVSLKTSNAPDAWDYQSTSYPHVFNFNGEVYMAYNGSRYGQKGFGLARLKHRTV